MHKTKRRRNRSTISNPVLSHTIIERHSMERIHTVERRQANQYASITIHRSSQSEPLDCMATKPQRMLGFDQTSCSTILYDSEHHSRSSQFLLLLWFRYLFHSDWEREKRSERERERGRIPFAE